VRKLSRYSFPGITEFVEMGYPPDAPPGIVRRADITARHVLSTLKLTGYQCWRLATLRQPTCFD
jgi:hypothetical protein